MFKNLIKELERMNEMSVSVGIETDENGYIDKHLPTNGLHCNKLNTHNPKR